ncbi:NAD(P)/FAD-dependent oxidoreductase [Fusobacterium sp. PH5-44]|uniref:NAD(P)/FAD-dependent oxidoreductase n=1 Tax=unclassified Fusobacterium TaxID=2648384 RepID=UPI003D197E59
MNILFKNVIVPILADQNKFISDFVFSQGISEENVNNIRIIKRSIDSRQKKKIKFVYNLQINLKEGSKIPKNPNIFCEKESPFLERKGKEPGKMVAIIGSGPAGLFAALRLAEHGYVPVIYEQGEDVDKRVQSVSDFVSYGILNTDSNVQFGEGGAGTFSDGKLNTRVKSEYIDKIFGEFVCCGAPKEIMWDYKPHIGTDILRKVVKNMRKKIIELGGKFYFESKVIDIIVKNNKIFAIKVLNNKFKEEIVNCDNVILAIGHSSRDTYRMLYRNGVSMESKAFAMGVRIEHLRSDIDMMQYGTTEYYDILGAATYNVVFNNHQDKRGTFSFCMCPGGEIVNGVSENGASLVNGMSYSKRNGKFSNSAIVVGLKENEFGSDIFSNMLFQEMIEKNAYEIMGGYGGLYQSVKDFLDGKTTVKEIESSYLMDLYSYNFEKIFPDVIIQNLKRALKVWSNNSFFINENTNLIGPETRTSSPIRILRNSYGESINIKGLFPVGEGAGYAGGITSSAIDGIKIVDLSFTNVL